MLQGTSKIVCLWEKSMVPDTLTFWWPAEHSPFTLHICSCNVKSYQQGAISYCLDSWTTGELWPQGKPWAF